MPTKNDLFPSKYYNSQDVRRGPILLTIDFVGTELVGEGAGKQEKAVVHFKEKNSKQLVLTPTKFDSIALITKSDETEEWGGAQIVLEAGKVQFQGKLVDSVVIRAPRNPKRVGLTESPPSTPPEPAPADVDAEFDDEISF
jgi:hypothetical protein